MPTNTLGAQGWPRGVILATDNTYLPEGSSPRGLNSALAYATTGVPYVQKRKGIKCMNRTPITGSPAILGNFGYYRVANATQYHLMLDALGRLTNRDTNNTFSSISTSFTAGTYYPDHAVASDLCFIVNGQDRLKFDGTSVTAFGIDRPTVGTLAGASGGVGLHNGTYELRVTFGVSGTGHESSASDTATATVTVANEEIDWSNIPVSADSQVDRRYLYARNTATQTRFYRVGTITNNVDTTATTSILDANATTPAPSTTERNRPPSGIKYLAYHQGRLFAATDDALYWSGLDAPEAFDPLSTDGVNAGDGEKFTGLESDGEVLLVFKENRVYGIFNGSDPAVWQIREIDGEHGCVNHRTIVSANGTVYWWSPTGLAFYTGSGVNPIGETLLGDLTETISVAELARASAANDSTQNRILIALPGAGQQRATFIIPFQTTLQVFEASSWDPMDAASLGESPDSTGISRAWLGNYAGQLFKIWESNNDGVEEGDVTGTWTANAISATSFTGLLDNDGNAAAFDTTGGGLIERKITWLDSNGQLVSDARRYLTANGTDSFTQAVATDGFTIGETYTFVIGGPNFQWDTPWNDSQLPWVKKRYEFFYTLTKGLNFGSNMYIDLAFDWDDANANAKERSFNSVSTSGLWDQALWDADVWDTPASVQSRYRVARVGFVWRARLRNSQANEPAAILRVGMDSRVQTRKA